MGDTNTETTPNNGSRSKAGAKGKGKATQGSVARASKAAKVASAAKAGTKTTKVKKYVVGGKNKNLISMVIPPDVAALVRQRLAEIHTALPDLVTLNQEQRRRMLRSGPRSRDFIIKALEIAPMVADYLPRNFDIDEMRKDVELMTSLYPIHLESSQLSQKIRDSYKLANSEAYVAALEVYQAAKKAQGEQGLDEAIAELSRRFAAARGKDDQGTDDEEE